MFDTIIAPILLILLSLILGGLIGAGCHNSYVRNDAYKAGVGEWYLDAEHQKQWRWKTNSSGIRQ